MEKTGCVVVGGGPAGMMLGLLLARAGVQVTVLEKHNDFFRDFRGDTVHASTIRLIDELGLGEEFRRLPQSRLSNVAFPVPGGPPVTMGNFDSLPPPYNYVAMMPQWDFLNFLADAAAQEPSFSLRMGHKGTSLVRNGGRVTGVRYRTADGAGGEIRADVVVATDGRHSALRAAAGLATKEYPVPFDAWWFRLPRYASEPGAVAGIVPAFGRGEALVALNRTDYYQMGYLAPKGTDARIRAEGIEGFRRRIAALRPDLADRVDAIASLQDLRWLDVRLDRLRQWHINGLLCIGDAAHAMSPAGGVGINLAVQDAVAAAEILAPALLRGQVPRAELAKVQRRRQRPTVIVQTVQRIMHRLIFGPIMTGKRSGAPAVLLFLGRRIPAIGRVMPRFIAFGPRPEHAPAFARRAPQRR
ncbi:2-polyprenyl-6-methoxyphenol hydroxylase-like FAD-dependent oxidoreductase [Pseudarthrobacter oxydans]|uniref:FAD-dependent oxidoreductase n=1 Tax=Pseudarthrobacter oxydans TaxID=1671 RepID=UPI00277DA396|nr:FAD-dependent oxidoreductase [Pseudarthrobacter oxydans]MDP9982607.1 2-polyprenyl-6-methoxyphenol hydroxylase-like FAD-dependent oxidoreductase [Pseudarthrobacter oxydans]